MPEYYECSGCGRTTTQPDHVHLAKRMSYSTAFGAFNIAEVNQFCCFCFREATGGCSEENLEAGGWS